MAKVLQEPMVLRIGDGGLKESCDDLDSQCPDSWGKLGMLGVEIMLRFLQGKADTNYLMCKLYCWLPRMFWMHVLWSWCQGHHLSVINLRCECT